VAVWEVFILNPLHRQLEEAKITALYSRLSMEDDLCGDSMSIQTQKALPAEYATKQGFTNVRHFTDDGKAGVNFDRDGWKQLIKEVEAGTGR